MPLMTQTNVVVLGYAPDKRVVDSIVAGLQSLGLEVWTDWTTEQGSSLPQREIRAHVKNAALTLLCFSKEAVDRRWFAKEHDICTTLLEGKHRQRSFRQVRIGDVVPTDIPDDLRTEDVDFLKFDPKDSASMARLGAAVFDLLAKPHPLVITGLLAAVSAAEWAEVAPALPPGVGELCTAFGIAAHDELAQRYGTNAEDFAPFDGHSITAVVDASLREGNRQRLAHGQPPLVLRWLDPTRFPDDGDLQTAWERGDSLLVVDAASTTHRRTAALLQSVPPHQEPHRCAVLWVPPYTRHTGQCAEFVKDAVKNGGQLAHHFRRWSQGDERDDRSSFDVTTPAGLQGWLYRAFLRAGTSRPDAARLQALRGDRPARDLDQLLGGAG
jgi:hypothetical protein